MLTYIPSIGKQPEDVPGLALSGSGASASLTDITLYVSVSGAATAIDLHSRSVSQVTGLLPSGVTGSVLRDGPAELLLWNGATSGVQSGALPVTLTLAASPLWQILAVFARALQSRRRALQSGVAQINVRAANGMWLDWWAASLGIARHAGEPDVLFSARLIGTTLEPRVNGTAIEALFSALGYGLTITDAAGSFMADVAFPANPSGGFTYSHAQIAAILGQVKAAGVTANISFLSAFSDLFSLSDTASGTTPGGPFVYGSSKYAETNWA